MLHINQLPPYHPKQQLFPLCIVCQCYAFLKQMPHARKNCSKESLHEAVLRDHLAILHEAPYEGKDTAKEGQLDIPGRGAIQFSTSTLIYTTQCSSKEKPTFTYATFASTHASQYLNAHCNHEFYVPIFLRSSRSKVV